MARPALPSPMRVLLAMTVVSCLGSGLTLPFLLVYLHVLRHIPLATTGLLIAVPAVMGLAATPAIGWLIDGLGARAVLVAALLLSSAGSAGLPATRTAAAAVVPLVGFGLGQAGLMTALNTLFVQLIEDEHAQVRAFSLEFTFVNLGIGAGALVAGSIVSLQHPGTFTVVYLLDALSFAVPAVVTAGLRLPSSAAGRGRAAASERTGAGGVSYRTILGDGPFVRYAVLTALLGFCGYAALDAAFVGYSTTVVGVRPSLVADAFAVNTGLIVAFQQLVTRAIVRVRRTTALAVTATCFGGAWVVEWMAGHFPGQEAGSVLVVVFGAVFAAGEMAFSPIRAVLLNALATDELRGRYNAAGFLAFQASNVAAPAIVGVLLGASLGGPMLLGLAGLGGAAALYALGLRRHLSPSQDNGEGDRPEAAATT